MRVWTSTQLNGSLIRCNSMLPQRPIVRLPLNFTLCSHCNSNSNYNYNYKKKQWQTYYVHKKLLTIALASFLLFFNVVVIIFVAVILSYIWHSSRNSSQFQLHSLLFYVLLVLVDFYSICFCCSTACSRLIATISFSLYMCRRFVFLFLILSFFC